ncbi:MAG TPA: DNA internalization-related competence protein ComEC/Rec2 [Desulfomonilia bacterium]|nr:DNA internalization-related competence protein ComEC/Rec2 [Desulfomonilia bacterium]
MLRETGRDNPLVVVFVALCCGVLLYLHDIKTLSFCFIILIGLFTPQRVIHAALGFVLGVSAIWIAPSWVSLDEGMHRIDGVICSSGYDQGTFRMVLEDVIADGKKIRGHALISVYGNTVPLAPGSVVSSVVRIRARMGFGNFGEFDYRLFLLEKGIVMTGSISKNDTLTIKRYIRPGGLKNRINTFLSGLARPEAEVLKAMFTGDTSGITDSIQDNFNSLGLTHLIAISGLNMTIIFFIGHLAVFSLLRVIPPLSLRLDTPLVAQICGIIGVISYTIFVGPNIPTIRAAIMVCCVVFGFLLLRKPHILESLAVAGIVILLKWPYCLYSASFILTFAAVLGIIGTIEKGASLPRWLHTVTIPIVVAVFTMPIIIYLFGFISWRGIIANILVVPFFSIAIMPLGTAGILLFPISNSCASTLFSLTNEAIGLLMTMSSTFGSVLAVPRPSIYWMYTCYVGLIIAFFSSKSTWHTAFLAALSLAVLCGPIVEHRILIKKPLCFDFISVGQGDSMLLTKGPHAALIDGGPAQAGFDAGRHVVAPHLLQRGIDRLDLIIVTHMHPDHSGGIPYILERFPVGEVWINDLKENNLFIREIMRISQEKSIPIRCVSLGDGMRLGTMSIKVMGPIAQLDTGKSKQDENMRSIVVLAGDDSLKGIFMGDADMFGELILAHLRKDVKAQVLKVAHHGGEKSCLGPFLDEVRPDVAVISCGANNRYGDPSPESLKRLADRGIKIFRTDLHGEVMITSLLSGFDVKSCRLPADNH